MSSMDAVSGSRIILNQTALSPELRGEGGFVFVRVQGRSPSGALIISVNGARFEATIASQASALRPAESQASSAFSLQAGDSFRARMTVDNGVITLTPDRLFRSSAQASAPDVSSPEAFFARTGLPAGDVTMRLLGFFSQLGLRIDTSLARRAMSIASRFPGKEKDAAEAALFMLEKGIEPTDEDILNLLELLESGAPDDGGGNRRENSGEREGREDAETRGKPGTSEVPGGLERLEGSGGEHGRAGGWASGTDLLAYLYAHPERIERRAGGLLTLLNHLVPGTGGGRRLSGADVPRTHWIVLPFEWDGDAGGESVQGAAGAAFRGTIRVLIDTAVRCTEKLCVTAYADCAEWRFSAKFGRSSPVLLEFCRIPALTRAGQEDSLKAMYDCYGNFPECEIRYAQDLADDGAFSVSGNFPAVDMEA